MCDFGAYNLKNSILDPKIAILGPKSEWVAIFDPKIT